MKVLLIDPPVSFLSGTGTLRHMLPMGLGCVGAALHEAGHEVRLLLPDLRAYTGDDPWGEIRRAVAAENPDVVGLTGMSPCAAAMERVVAEVRAALGPEVPLVVGGQHAMSWPRGVAAWPGVTCVVRGEGDDAMLGLVEGWRRGSFDPTTVPGVVATRGGELVEGPPPIRRADLDTLPLTFREGLVWADQLHPALYESMYTQRGRPYGCIYCSLTFAERGTRYHSAARVVEEAEHVRDHFGARSLVFYDPVFTLNRRRTLEMMTLFKERGLHMPFMCQTRADRMDAELAAAMAERGCTRVFLGIESGDEDTLARLSKPMKLDTIRQAVDVMSGAGITVCGYFMVGFPWEDAPRIRKTVDFALGLGLDWVSLHSATPVPGTALWDMVPSHLQVTVENFLAPDLNLTAMADEDYRTLFTELRTRCERHNVEVQQRRFPQVNLPQLDSRAPGPR